MAEEKGTPHKIERPWPADNAVHPGRGAKAAVLALAVYLPLRWDCSGRHRRSRSRTVLV